MEILLSCCSLQQEFLSTTRQFLLMQDNWSQATHMRVLSKSLDPLLLTYTAITLGDLRCSLSHSSGYPSRCLSQWGLVSNDDVCNEPANPDRTT